MIITSDKLFFESLGWVQGEPAPQEILKFFDWAYRFALREIGYHGTDKNILSAVIHFDETTPHLQLYYIPIVDEGKKKVYEKGADGKVLRNAKGSPVQKKDSQGKSVYEYVKLDKPKICSSDFWEQRGGLVSFGNLQEAFYDCVSRRYGLERGEIGSNKKHTTKYEWEKQKQDEELKDRQEYLDAFDDAIKGKKPFFKGQLEKQIVGLTVKYKELEKQKMLSDEDKQYIFSELQKCERELPRLRKVAEFVSFIQQYAPDELKIVNDIAHENEKSLRQTKSHNFFDYRSK